MMHLVGLNEISHMPQPVEKPLRLFPDTQDLIEVDPRKLIELDRLPLPGAHQAQRSLKHPFTTRLTCIHPRFTRPFTPLSNFIHTRIPSQAMFVHLPWPLGFSLAPPTFLATAPEAEEGRKEGDHPPVITSLHGHPTRI